MKIAKVSNVPYKMIGGSISKFSDCEVKYTDLGNIKEVMYMRKKYDGGQFGITKLSKDEYMVNDTGEVKEYNHGETRKDNSDNLRRTFKKIRNIINYNFCGGSNELMFTGTYADNMTDNKQLYDDFRKFIQKLKYKYGHIEYMSIVEPQGRGAWHCHVLLKFMDVDKIYIPNKEIAEIWGKGFVTVRRIRNDVDNLGAYLSAYLGDIEVCDENTEIVKQYISDNKIVEYKNVEIDGKQKKFVKGGRLHLYPVGMNIYRKSRGIKEPVSEMVQYNDIEEIQNVNPSYVSAISICDDEGAEVNKIIYEIYNTKGKKENV